MKIYVKSAKYTKETTLNWCKTIGNEIQQAIEDNILAPERAEFSEEFRISPKSDGYSWVGFYPTDNGKSVAIRLHVVELALVKLSAVEARGTSKDQYGFNFGSYQLGKLPKDVKLKLYDNLDKVAELLPNFGLKATKPIRPSTYWINSVCTAPVEVLREI